MKLIDLFTNPNIISQNLIDDINLIEYKKCFNNDETLNYLKLCIFLQNSINESTIKYFDYSLEHKKIILQNIKSNVENIADVLIEQFSNFEEVKLNEIDDVEKLQQYINENYPEKTLGRVCINYYINDESKIGNNIALEIAAGSKKDYYKDLLKLALKVNLPKLPDGWFYIDKKPRFNNYSKEALIDNFYLDTMDNEYSEYELTSSVFYLITQNENDIVEEVVDENVNSKLVEYIENNLEWQVYDIVKNSNDTFYIKVLTYSNEYPQNDLDILENEFNIVKYNVDDDHEGNFYINIITTD